MKALLFCGGDTPGTLFPSERWTPEAMRPQSKPLTLEEAWQAYMAADVDAQELHASGAGAKVLQSVVLRARELLAAIDNELAANRLGMPDEQRQALQDLRAEWRNSGPARTPLPGSQKIGAL